MKSMSASRSTCSGDIYITEPVTSPLVIDTPTSRSAGRFLEMRRHRRSQTFASPNPAIRPHHRADQDIVGFNVAVQHADSVGIAQRVANLQDDIHELRKVVSLSVVKQLSKRIAMD